MSWILDRPVPRGTHRVNPRREYAPPLPWVVPAPPLPPKAPREPLRDALRSLADAVPQEKLAQAVEALARLLNPETKEGA